MKKKGIKQFLSLVIILALMFMTMMPIGVAHAAGPVSSITVTGAGNATTVVNGSTLAMSAAILPLDATDPSVTWSVGTLVGGTATIVPATGVLTGTGVGTVIVIATANDGSGTIGTKTITVTAAPVAVTGITVTGAGNATTVVNGSTLAMSAAILPLNATNPSVTWSVSTLVGGTATINPTTGVLTGTGVGTVLVIATANDGSGIAGTKTITVTAPVAVMGITVTGAGNATTVFKGGTLAMTAAILPLNATNTNVTWSVETLAGGTATIVPATGVLTGTGAGTVIVKATANDGSGITGTKEITVTVAVTGITVTGAGNASTVVSGSTLAMSAAILPLNATNQSVTWSVATLAGGTATIVPATGVLTGTGVGTVRVTATANDGSGKTGTKTITVTAAAPTTVDVTGITVTGLGGATTVVKGSTLAMSAAILPLNATNQSVTWSVVPLAGGTATIVPATGVLTGIGVGTVTVTATAKDGSGTTGTRTITVLPVAVTGITVTGAGGATNVVKGGTLAMSAAILPLNATNQSLTWSVATLAGGTATIVPTTGVLTGTGVGTVTVTATANDGSGTTGAVVITVINVFTITAPVLPTITTTGVPVPMTITSYGTGEGPFEWDWTGITLEDTTIPTSPINIPYSYTPGTDNDDMTITPNEILDFGKTYTLTIPAGSVTDALSNTNSAFSFNPVIPSVGINAIDLVAGETGVSVKKVIKLTTNVLCSLDEELPITLVDAAGNICTLTFSLSDENEIVVVPSEGLSGGNTYTLTIPAGALIDSTGLTNEQSSITFTTAYNLNDLINNVYSSVTLNSLMAAHSPRGLEVHVPKRYLTKFDIAYSTNLTNPLTNVDITAEDEVAKINVQFGTNGRINQAIKTTTGWNTGYEGSLTTLDTEGQILGKDIIFEAFDEYGRSLEKKTYIKLNVKGSKLDLSKTKSLNVSRTFADLILSNGKLLTDILKQQYTLDELSLSIAP